MKKSEILDSFLLPLADAFETGKNAGCSITHSNAEEYEPLRQCLAEEIADGSLTDPRGMKIYHLTKRGYAKHKQRIEALRALPR